ncbi:family 78 glycoside hydrolase catalytic domain [Streptosporangium fragile]|uniref:alpha-L-rhamnosidase n=1 Tax=Streptosporangium fragile TaxID=46186 RepID=A0ABN3W1W2_9ACTN
MLKRHARLGASVAAILTALCAAPAPSAAADAGPGATGLRAADLREALGIDDTTPPLTWRLRSGARGVTQSAYQVQAATDRKLLEQGQPDLWDTGQVDSAAQRVDYAGTPIGSRTRVHWRVRVWTGGRPSAWSAPAWFETGLTAARDWSAAWITHRDWQFKAKQPTPMVVRLPKTTARYVRLDVTRLGLPLVENLPDPSWRLRLAEVEVRDSADAGVNLAAGATVTSSDTGGRVNRVWDTRYLTDGTQTTNQTFAGWSSSAYPGADVSAKPITVTLDLKAVKTFDQVLLYPRTDVPAEGGKVPNAPVDYSVSTADTAEGPYTTRQTVTGQEPPVSPVPVALPILAKDFDLPGEIRSARLYVSGLGIHEVAVNGRRVGDTVLEPGNTDFADRVQYATHDVTRLLRRGANTIGVSLGNGASNVISTPDRYRKFAATFSDPKLIAQLEVTRADGTVTRLVTGDDWLTTLGPTTFSNWYGGEDYDARRELPGWDRPGAKRDGWQPPVAVAAPGEATVLSGRSAEPIRVIDTLEGTPVGGGDGYQVFDLGRNIAGWPELTVTAPAGTTVRVHPAESLKDGRAYQSASNVGAPIWDQYTTRGTGEPETWHPRFSYHGFRYLEVRGAPAGTQVSVRGHVLHTDNASAGSFSSSNQLVNGIHSLIRRAIEGNMMSVFTDCPSREKLGWLEQVHLVSGALTGNYDVQAQLRKVVQDMADAQTPTGLVPSTVPDYTVLAGAYRDDPNWGGAFVVVPWQLYRTYGDTETMRTHYEAMRKYAAYLEARAVGGLTDYSLGDWITPDRTFPKMVSGTYGYWRVLDTMSKIAEVLGHTADAAGYRAKADASAKALSDRYYDPATGTFAGGGQGAEALALDMGAVPADQRQRLLDHLIGSIEQAGWHLLLGEISLPAAFRVLSESGRDDVVYKIATQTTSPSYGYQVVHGNTSLGEMWDGTSGQSQNHFMLGSIDSWFTGRLAGIEQAADSVGFRKLVIAPAVVGDLTGASGSYRSPYGEIRTAWTKTDGRFELVVTVPPGSTAEVRVPLADGARPEAPHGATPVRATATEAVYGVGSGTWTFQAVTGG